MKTSTPPTKHSWAALISNGDMADSNFDMIQMAKREIYLVEFLVRDDEFGSMKLALLRRKAREGVQVHMHVDAFHLLVHPALVKHLMDEGIDFTVFNELSFSRLNKATTRNHCKLLVIDEHLLKMGDANTGNEYVHWGSGHQMKSIDVIIEGTVATKVRQYAMQVMTCELSKAPEIEIASEEDVKAQRAQIENLKQVAKTFFQLLQIQMDAPDQFTRPQKVLITEAELQAAIGNLDLAEKQWERRDESRAPESRQQWQRRFVQEDHIQFHADPMTKPQSPDHLVDDVNDAICAVLRRAENRIVIVTPYLLLTDTLCKEIKTALADGVKIQFYTNSMKSTDNKTTQLAYEYRLEDVAGLGDLQIFEYQGAETIHAKFILCDTKDCMVMTYNLDWRSELLNLETAVEFYSEALTADLENWLEKHRHEFKMVASEGHVLKTLPPTNGASELAKRFLIQAIEKQL